MTPRRLALSGAAALLARPGLAVTIAPLDLVLPFQRGTIPDRIARSLAEHAQVPLGRGINLRNRPGTDSVAATDGTALLLSPIAPLLGPLRQPQRGAIHRLAPLLPIAATPLVVVSGRGGYDSLLHLAMTARRHPGSVTWGIAGAGSASYLAMMETEEQVAGQFRTVSLPSPESCIAATIAGRVALTAAPAALLTEGLRDGGLTALLVTAPDRLPLLPQVPAAAETQMSGLNVTGVLALFAPRAVSAAILAPLVAAFGTARATPGFAAGLQSLGSVVAEGDAASVTAIAAREASRWYGVVERFALR